ncbi:MAG TPA: mechanosensitive ion channel family protein [Balneolaceae bacterium]|nr:mechanosensitive ion channel family protein [Balneolaceae bacterium]
MNTDNLIVRKKSDTVLIPGLLSTKTALFVCSILLFFSVLIESATAQQTADNDTAATDSVLVDTAAAGTDTTAVILESDQVEVNIEQTEPDTAESDGGLPAEAKDDISQIRQLISFNKILLSVFILIATSFFNKLLNKILDNLSEKATNYRLFIKRLTPISRIFIWTLAIYVIIAGVIAPPFETIVTIGASIGIAVGFASQDILKNVFGGIMIILDRPFQVGDKIEVGEHYGEVLSIGLRSSRVVTPDDSIVSIPNGDLMNRSVSNANSSALDCQVVTEIFLPAIIDIDAVKKLAFQAVYSSPYTYMNKPVVVIVLNEVNNRGLFVKLRIKAYVLDIRYEFLFKSDVTEMVVKECNKRGWIPNQFLSEIDQEENEKDTA